MWLFKCTSFPFPDLMWTKFSILFTWSITLESDVQMHHAIWNVFELFRWVKFRKIVWTKNRTQFQELNEIRCNENFTFELIKWQSKRSKSYTEPNGYKSILLTVFTFTLTHTHRYVIDPHTKLWRQIMSELSEMPRKFISVLRSVNWTNANQWEEKTFDVTIKNDR